MTKCQFVRRKLEFLRHTINPERIEPLPDKVTAIIDYPKPRDQLRLRRFLGLVYYFQKFTPNAAETLAPMNNLIKLKRKGTSTVVTWSPETEKAFTLIKIQLAHFTALKFPSVSAH